MKLSQTNVWTCVGGGRKLKIFVLLFSLISIFSTSSLRAQSIQTVAENGQVLFPYTFSGFCKGDDTIDGCMEIYKSFIPPECTIDFSKSNCKSIRGKKFTKKNPITGKDETVDLTNFVNIVCSFTAQNCYRPNAICDWLGSDGCLSTRLNQETPCNNGLILKTYKQPSGFNKGFTHYYCK